MRLATPLFKMKGENIMYTKTIKYTDYNGVEREENFYFNLNKAELLKMEMSKKGGLAEMINRIVQSQDAPAIMEVFEDLILKAYGEKDAEGKRFVKSEEISQAFKQTEAYSILFMELATDANAASEFINKIIPQDLNQQMQASANHPANK